jgi:TRAP-type C4-dicarboxylate transport system substrate-binding protein
MKRYFLGAFGVAALVAAAAGAQTPEKLPATKINVVGNLGITTQYKELEVPFWTEKVPAASGGAITATIKPWNEMGLKGPEVFRLLRQGLFDVATAQMGHMAGDAPINDATDLAGLSPTIDTFRKVTDAFRPELERYYGDEFKAKLLGLWSFQAQVLYCRDQIRGLADVKGKRVRTSGASQSDFIEHFGGAGVNMAFGEVQQALANGVIDCAITGTLGGYKAKWHESAKEAACRARTSPSGASCRPRCSRSCSRTSRRSRPMSGSRTSARTTSASPATPGLPPAPKVQPPR